MVFLLQPRTNNGQLIIIYLVWTAITYFSILSSYRVLPLFNVIVWIKPDPRSTVYSKQVPYRTSSVNYSVFSRSCEIYRYWLQPCSLPDSPRQPPPPAPCTSSQFACTVYNSLCVSFARYSSPRRAPLLLSYLLSTCWLLTYFILLSCCLLLHASLLTRTSSSAT